MRMMQSNKITLDNGIEIDVTTNIEDDGYTSINVVVSNMDIDIGKAINHVGGRPKTRPKKKP